MIVKMPILNLQCLYMALGDKFLPYTIQVVFVSKRSFRQEDIAVDNVSIYQGTCNGKQCILGTVSQLKVLGSTSWCNLLQPTITYFQITTYQTARRPKFHHLRQI